MENLNANSGIGDISQLKQKALPYLPRNLSEIESHRQILRSIARVVPSVIPFISQADREIWSKVQTRELAFNAAIAQCAFRVDTIIETTAFSKQSLLPFSEKDLMSAWIALDYYAYVLKTEYSINIVQLQKNISEVLLSGKAGQGAISDYGVTRPIEPPRIPDIPKEIPPKKPPLDKPDDHAVPPKKPVIKKEKPDIKKEKPVLDSNKKKNRKKLILLAAAAVVIALVIAFFCSDVQQTKSAIRKIKEVTLDSETQILHAEELYGALEPEQQEKVDNRSELFSARTEYDSLVAEDAINKIGTVTMESKDAIVHAEALYAKLSKDSKNLVDNYKKLTAARKEYDRLEAAVAKAEKAINAIGQVTLESGDKIAEARKAYDALKKDNLQKYLSKEATTLTDAETKYDQLVSQDLYETGLAHHQDKQYEEAIKCFNTIITDYADTEVVEDAQTAKVDSQVALAEQSYSKRDYYTTMKALSEVDAKYQQQESYQQLHEKTIKALEKARPRNGAQIAGNTKWGYCHFNITASNQDVCFKFQDASDPSKFKLVFVRAGETAKVNIADGKYSIKFATGKYWYDKDHLFGDDTQYKGRGEVDFETSYSGNWVYYWTCTLDMTDSDFSSYSIDAKDF